MYQKPTLPRPIGGVLDDTLQLFKASLPKCLLPALLISVIATAVSLYQLSRQPVLIAPLANFQAALARYQFTSPTSVLLAVFNILLQLVLYAILIFIIVGVARGAAPSLGASITTALKRLPAMIGASIVIGIVATVGVGVAAIPAIVVAVRARGGTPAQILVAELPMILVFLVLVFPVIYVLSRMQLFLVPLVSETQGPLRSIGISWRLVGGNWWRTTTVVFILGVIIYVLTIILFGIAAAVAAVAVGVAENRTQMAGALAVVQLLAAGLAQIIATPLLMALHVTLYQDLQLRKGGSDLEARLGALPKG